LLDSTADLYRRPRRSLPFRPIRRARNRCRSRRTRPRGSSCLPGCNMLSRNSRSGDSPRHAQPDSQRSSDILRPHSVYDGTSDLQFRPRDSFRKRFQHRKTGERAGLASRAGTRAGRSWRKQ
jgi:hypothetical protein